MFSLSITTRRPQYTSGSDARFFCLKIKADKVLPASANFSLPTP